MENLEERKEVNELKLWLESIPMGNYEAIRRQILERCKTKDYIFRNWKCGVTKVPLLEKSIINKIALEYNGSTCFL